ncbi:hypothetical protein ACFXAS_05355 [Streptomyces sp. NPDC059459]|uniref:hypothetical protein n=1 Tax=Streptomyces sp. NPDC059459 TaxID=3346839 RepID=UPI00368FA999
MNVDQWNARHLVGTPVFAYPGCRPEDGTGTRLVTRTRTEAQLSASGDPVVWVEGEGSYICLTHVDPVAEDVWEETRKAEKQAEPTAPASQRLGHATLDETIPALLATIKELRALRQPLIDALTLVHQSMTSCVGDEWAMEWLGEVWTQIPLHVRAAAGDKDAAAELAEAGA